MKYITKENFYKRSNVNYEIEKGLPEWYYNLSIHDSKIISALPKGDRTEKFNLDLIDVYCPRNCKGLIFIDCIFKEKCEIENAYCLASELYRKYNGRYEFHLLVENSHKGKSQLDYLTINCKEIALKTD